MKSTPRSRPASPASGPEAEASPWSIAAQEAVTRAAGLAFYQCPPDLGPMRFRGATEHLLGPTETVLKGGRAEWLERVHPDDRAEVAALDAAAREAHPHSLDYRLNGPGGATLWLRETQTLVRDAASGCLVRAGTLAEVTAAREMALKLRHYQKEAVFGECARGIAHDFNNVLALFQGYAELLQSDTDPDAAEYEYLEEMLAAVERARAITQQIHRVSHIKPERPALVDWVTLVRDFRPLLRRLAREDVEIVITAKTEEAWIKADPQELETLLLNLAANACEAMPQAGRLELELSRTGRQAQLTIRDTGEGIRKADLPKIFEPGFTTRKRQSAAGMGLALCRDIAARLGGSVSARSTPGKGSEFQVTLPARTAPRRPEQEAKGPPPPGRGERILVVEDDPFARQALLLCLQHLGYEVREAANGDEALRALEKDSKIRLVIADVFMPIMGGGELAGTIQSRWHGLPVILVSGYASPIVPDAAKPTQLFLPKPLATSILARHIRQLIDA